MPCGKPLIYRLQAACKPGCRTLSIQGCPVSIQLPAPQALHRIGPGGPQRLPADLSTLSSYQTYNIAIVFPKIGKFPRMPVRLVFPAANAFFIVLARPSSGKTSFRRVEMSIRRISFHLGSFLPIFVLLKATIQILKKPRNPNPKSRSEIHENPTHPILQKAINILWKTNKYLTKNQRNPNPKKPSGPILKN
jgi:hypothetical protein